MVNYRILFIISSLRGGGAENHLLNLCRYLASHSHACAVCTLSASEDGLEKIVLEEGIDLYRVPLGSLINLLRPRSIRAFRRILNRFRPDLIHAHLFHGEIAAVAASLLSGLPVLATRHSSGLEFASWRAALVRILRPRYSRLIAVSGMAAGEAVRLGFREETIVTIPNGIDTGRFKPLDPSERVEHRRSFLARYLPGADPDSCLLVGAVGGLKHVKNYPLFIRTAAGLLESMHGHGRDLRFAIAGDGAERERLAELATRSGLGGRFVLTGHIEDLERIYPLFDIYILPSLTEGVPLALLEAMSCGLACIASDVGDIRRILADTGIIVKPDDAGGFLAAARTLLDDDDRRAELGRRARVRILERYDIEIWATKTLDIYKNILSQRR